MNQPTLQLERTWEEILTQSNKLAGQRVRVIVLTDVPIKSPEDSFIQALKEIKEGKVRPISELWEGINAE